jgi:hypothetical protein
MGKKMATSSFDRPLAINTDEAADALIRAMENPAASKFIDKDELRVLRERGEAFLRKRSSP